MTEGGLPTGWAHAHLGDLIDGFDAGRNLRAHGRPAEGAECGVLKVSAVSWGRFKAEENKALLVGDAPRPREIVKKGDLLISRANTTALVGAVVYVEEDHPNLMLPDKLLRLRFRPELVVPQFLVHALRLPAVRKYFEANATGTSDSMRNLAQPKIEAAPVPLAPLKEQRRIVAKLDVLQSRSRRAREALDAVPPLLEKLRQSILAAAFRGDLTKDWRATQRHVEPASELLKRIRVERREKWEEAELGKMKAKGKAPSDERWKAKYKEPEPVSTIGLPELPEGWCWASPDELSAPVPNALTIGPFGSDLKVSDYRDDGVPLVFVRDIRAESFGDEKTKFVTEEKATALSRHLVRPGELLITKMGDPPGDTAVYPAGRPPAVITADCIKLTPFGPVTDGSFLRYCFRAQPVRSQLLEQTAGVAQQKLSLERFRTVFVPLPSREEQRELVTRLDTLLDQDKAVLESVDSVRAQLDNLHRASLAKAFRGQLAPQDWNDEPAEAMLARARDKDGAAATPARAPRRKRAAAGAGGG